MQQQSVSQRQKYNKYNLQTGYKTLEFEDLHGLSLVSLLLNKYNNVKYRGLKISVNSINTSSAKQIRARVNKTLTNGIQIDMSTEECKKLLRRHVKNKTHIAIMFTDIDGSTEMSFILPSS